MNHGGTFVSGGGLIVAAGSRQMRVDGADAGLLGTLNCARDVIGGDALAGAQLSGATG